MEKISRKLGISLSLPDILKGIARHPCRIAQHLSERFLEEAMVRMCCSFSLLNNVNNVKDSLALPRQGHIFMWTMALRPDVRKGGPTAHCAFPLRIPTVQVGSNQGTEKWNWFPRSIASSLCYLSWLQLFFKGCITVLTLLKLLGGRCPGILSMRVYRPPCLPYHRAR